MSPRRKSLKEKNTEKKHIKKKKTNQIEKNDQISLDFIEDDSALDLIEETLSKIDSTLVEGEDNNQPSKTVKKKEKAPLRVKEEKKISTETKTKKYEERLKYFKERAKKLPKQE